MDIRKTPGSVTRHSVNREDMALINRLAKTELTPEQVYTFAVRLCDNEVDRDWERFDEAGLEALSALFVGKSGIFDHHWSAQEQTARLYRTEVCRESGTTAAGDGIRYLKGYAYMLRSEKNRDLIEEIEAGIKKEVSVGCSVARRVCSVCGAEDCGHVPGQVYDGKLCFWELRDIKDAYEWSFVAVPAQRRAGVIKSAGRRVEDEARLGRKYLKSLRAELVRLAGIAEPGAGHALLERAAAKLDEEELVGLIKVCRGRTGRLFAQGPQLSYGDEAARPEDGCGAFLI